MAGRWPDELEALEEGAPRRSRWRWLTVLLLIALGAGVAYGIRELRVVRVGLVELEALRDQIARLQRQVVTLEERMVESPARGPTESVADRPRVPVRSTEEPPSPEARSRIVEHVVKSGESLWGIARRYEIEMSALRWANPELRERPLLPGQTLVIPSSKGFYVGVERGETLSGLATRYRVSVEMLMKANRLKDPDRLFAGTRLLIPAPESRQ